MKIKSVFKFIGGMIAGMAIGLLMAWILIMIFTDKPMAQIGENFLSTDFVEMAYAGVLSIVLFALCMVIQIIGHEGGHLVGGLLTGYRFVSFRIFSLTLLRRDGRWTVRRFSLAGTGGQCLLSPPDMLAERIPFVIYNAGGVAFNLITILLAAVAAWAHPGNLSEVQFLFLLMLALSGLFTFILNGIPITAAGMPNDAHNIMTLWRHPETRRHFILQLRVNALAQDGTRLKDMPDEWFEDDLSIPPLSIHHTVSRLLIASRLLDSGQTDEAHAVLSALNADADHLPMLVANEIRTELTYTSLALGYMEDATRLLTPTLRRYIRQTAKVMSSKQRLLCAMALRMDGDGEKAAEILRKVENQRDKYVIRGEVEMDIDLMHRILKP